MTAPTVLHLTNDTHPEVHLSFGKAFRELAADGLLTHVPLAPVALLARDGREEALREIRRVAEQARPELVFVQTPGRFPWTDKDVADLLLALDAPTVVLWEGDPWGGRKALPASLVAWLRYADTVYTVGLGVQGKLLGRHTARPPRYISQTVPERLWTEDPVPHPSGAAYDVLHIGSCFVRFGLFERIDGARERVRLVRSLQRLPGCRFGVYGNGWRGPGALGPVPFDDQLTALRTARISANWDHFAGRDGYFSNRLPISLFAGRPHVTTRPLNAPWLPGPECGLHLADSPAEAVALVKELLRADPEELHTAGLAGHRWVRERLTNLNALRHMFSSHLDVPPPPADPWAAIAATDETGRVPEPV
ncbi:hypothetical protein H9Y04_17840 [Streptomyces sp. TRM66268-LWL]|uniref:Spore protein YkvP/CgeB glycosyl transferase-like domain-containing protein n=1 Tax=Streptomyces polyasparticus TaxID=2767826 RepID=A0ABR7SGT3_9ACTN|nr:hypothetical protein [Streptomyces polyasparticus]MBC9714424.1 hypothetical protein [Streptomyces polyasparticus]